MKISELVATLEERKARHGDLELRVTWEGRWTDIFARSVWKGKDGALYIDADGNFYKSTDAEDPDEGETASTA